MNSLWDCNKIQVKENLFRVQLDNDKLRSSEYQQLSPTPRGRHPLVQAASLTTEHLMPLFPCLGQETGSLGN